MKNEIQMTHVFTGELPEALKGAAIDVFLDGFGRKVDHLMLKPKSRGQAKRLYLDGADFSSALFAIAHGDVVGVLGFQFQQKKFINLNFACLREEFGFFGGMARKLSGSVFKDILPLKEDELRVQVISVARAYRGTGVGHRLLDSLFALGNTQGCSGIRLEVVNTNPHAMRLYKTLGFKTRGWIPYGPIASKAGFTSQFLMKKPL